MFWRKLDWTYCFSRRIMSQLQNWAFFTYLYGKPRKFYTYPMEEHQNVSNTSRHQEVVVLFNLPYNCHFSCLENFKCSFWKINIFAVVTLFFWRSDIAFWSTLQNSNSFWSGKKTVLRRMDIGNGKFIDVKWNSLALAMNLDLVAEVAVAVWDECDL